MSTPNRDICQPIPMTVLALAIAVLDMCERSGADPLAYVGSINDAFDDVAREHAAVSDIFNSAEAFSSKRAAFEALPPSDRGWLLDAFDRCLVYHAPPRDRTGPVRTPGEHRAALAAGVA